MIVHSSPATVATGGAGAAAPDAVGHEGLDFTAVFRAHSATAWRLLQHLGVAPRDAMDVCHEVFLIVHRKLDQIESPTAVRSFVVGVCVRAAADYRKSARVRREIMVESMPEGVQAIGPEDLLQRREWADFLRLVLERMDEKKREVFVLYEMDELSMPEIAKIMGTPLQTAYSRLHAAREEVKAAFKQHDVGGAQ